MLAIDFGTTRTKAAWYDHDSNKVELLKLGRTTAWMPSLCYLGPDGVRLFGDDAAEMLESDPQRVVRTLKRQLRNKHVRAGDQRAATMELVASLLSMVRKQAGLQAPLYRDHLPNSVVLTLPAAGQASGAQIEDVLRQAALTAGFTEVHLLTEPEAAAVAWMRQTGTAATDPVVVVLDCGGGTVDWACLRRRTDRLALVADCPPGGDDNTGGEFLDEALLQLVRDKLTKQSAVDALQHVEARANWFYSKVRNSRERFCNSGGQAAAAVDRIVVQGFVVDVSPDEMRAVLDSGFTDRICTHLSPYLDDVRRTTGTAQPRVLLVGGSARVLGLASALESRCQSIADSWEDADFAAVIGAAWALAPVEEEVDTLRMRLMHQASNHASAMSTAPTPAVRREQRRQSAPIPPVAAAPTAPALVQPPELSRRAAVANDDDGERTRAIPCLLPAAATTRPPAGLPPAPARAATTGAAPQPAPRAAAPQARTVPAAPTMTPVAVPVPAAPQTEPAPARRDSNKLRQERETLDALMEIAEQAATPKRSNIGVVAAVAAVVLASAAWFLLHERGHPAGSVVAAAGNAASATPAAPPIAAAGAPAPMTAPPAAAAAAPFAGIPEGDATTGTKVRDVLARQANAVQKCYEGVAPAGSDSASLAVHIVVQAGSVRTLAIPGQPAELTKCVHSAFAKVKALDGPAEDRQYHINFRVLSVAPTAPVPPGRSTKTKRASQAKPFSP